MYQRWAWSTVVALGITAASDSADFRDLLEKKTFTDAPGATLNYRLLKPAEIDAGKKYPLVVFLHGGGERGDDNTAQLVHGIREFAAASHRQKYPCFLIAPQSPRDKTWADNKWTTKEHALPEKPVEPMRLTLELIDSLVKEFPIDADRIYITGLSMGGYGTWDALVRRPNFFAAAVPVCGGADVKMAVAIKHVPVWVFHGDKDAAVPVSRSREIVEALKKAGGKPKYTEYLGVGHKSWEAAYADPALHEWLFAQKRAKK